MFLGVATCLLAAGGCTAARVHYESLGEAPPPLAGVEATLYLVGDAGQANPAREAVLSHLRSDIEAVTQRRPGSPIVVAFLGDNIYDVGAREEHRDEDFAVLEVQADALGDSPAVQGIFVPGNHDWASGAGTTQAREAIHRQQEWLAEMSSTHNVQLLPSDACPGPAALDLGSSLRLLSVDTEWLLRLPDDDCGGADAFYERLRAELEAHRDRRVVVVAHHPMATGGPHGGNVGLFSRGPLVYYLAVKSGVGVQDLASARYSNMLTRLRAVFRSSGGEPFVFAAGHDHTLQVIRMAGPGEPRYQLVSGSASKSSPVDRIEGTRFATDEHGYIRLEFEGSAARLVVFARDTDSGEVGAVFRCSLTAQALDQECPEAALAGGGQ